MLGDIMGCQCNGAGFCHIMNRHMSHNRYNQCKNENGYYEVFLKDAQNKSVYKLSTPNSIENGPGTELKKLLKKIGIEASPNCSCNNRAKKMDEMGIEWCENNIEEIVDWLQEEASKRGLPFLRIAGRKLVRIAINRARKAK